MNIVSKPNKVYLIKDRNGNLAPGTKIYTKKSGAATGRNTFIYYSLQIHCNEYDTKTTPNICPMYFVFSTHYRLKQILTLDIFSKGSCSKYYWAEYITQEYLDYFYKILQEFQDEWNIETIDQHY